MTRPSWRPTTGSRRSRPIPFVAEALGVEEKSPILLIERVSYSLDQRPVDYEKLFYRGDKLRLTTRLRRRPSPIPLEALPKIAPKKDPMSIGSPVYSLLVCLASLAAGLLGGMLGMAAGIFIVPALTLAFGLDIRHAVGASLVSVIGCSCGSAASAMENRLTNVRLAILLEIGTTLGALTGVVLGGVFPEPALYLLFAAILVVSAHQMSRKRKAAGSPEGLESPPDRWATRLRLNSSYPEPLTRQEVAYSVNRVWLGLFLMYAAGAMSSLLGIGSGVLKVPAMDSALRLPIKVSSATSNFMIGVTAAASAGIYYARGDILPDVAAPVALGSIFGAYLGAKILMRTSNERIRTLFIIVLLALAVKMCLAAFQGKNPTGGLDDEHATDDRRRLRRMEGILAGLLRYGALVASGWIAVGMVMSLFGGAASKPHLGLADRCMAIGIVLLIALPVLRVALTSAVFLFERDYLFAAISGAVLAHHRAGIPPGHRRRPLTTKGEGPAIEAIRSRRSRCSSCETRPSGASGCRCRSA